MLAAGEAAVEAEAEADTLVGVVDGVGNGVLDTEGCAVEEDDQLAPKL